MFGINKEWSRCQLESRQRFSKQFYICTFEYLCFLSLESLVITFVYVLIIKKKKKLQGGFKI